VVTMTSLLGLLVAVASQSTRVRMSAAAPISSGRSS
jgi:hypothetical protein